MLCVTNSRLNSRPDLLPANLAVAKRTLHFFHPAPKAVDIRPDQPGVSRKDSPAQERDPVLTAIDAAFALVNAQSQPGEALLDTAHHTAERLFRLVEQQEVVDTTNERPRPEFPVHHLVERVEVDVGEELRRLISQRQAAPALLRREEVVTGEVLNHVLLRV